MTSTLNSLSIYKTLLKWKKVFIITALGSALLSFVFSSPFFIKPKYKSTAIVYPSSLQPYSDESPTEQLLQLFESDDIRMGIIKKFNLIKHYNIDTTKKYYQSQLYGIYKDNIKISKTEYESVEIQTMDTSPDTASAIAESLIDLVNEKTRNLHRNKTQESVTINEKIYVQKKRQVDSLKNVLDSVRMKYEIIDYGVQLKEASRQFFNLAQTSTPQEQNYLTKFMKNMQEKGGELYLINESYSSAVYEFQKIQLALEGAKFELQKVSQLTYTSTVTKPYPSDKKSYPVRWVIVLLSVISSLVLAITIIAFIEKNKQINVE